MAPVVVEPRRRHLPPWTHEVGVDARGMIVPRFPEPRLVRRT